MQQNFQESTQAFAHKNFKFFQPCVTLWLSSVLKENPDAINHTFEERELLLNRTDDFIDVQNFKYQNMQWRYLIKSCRGNFLRLSATETLKMFDFSHSPSKTIIKIGVKHSVLY